MENRDRLSRLPAELLSIIRSNLTNRDIKNLRLTNKTLSLGAKLRLNRVFLSANPRNIEVFRAIADHETFRKEVVEIIWDDAILPSSRTSLDNYNPELDYEDDFDHKYCCQESPPCWFSKACEENIFDLRSRMSRDNKDGAEYLLKLHQIEHEMPSEEAWKHYNELLKEQREVLQTESDVDAFRYGLERFPQLKRVEVTPAAHGWLYTPLYQTPMIRALPYGFNYPLPRGWPCFQPGETRRCLEPWDSDHTEHKWRGFNSIVQQLAQIQHHVSEFLVTAHYLDTGLNSRIFEETCAPYTNFTALLQTTGFRRLDLDLEVAGQISSGWPAFRSTYLRRALANAVNLEHISLRSDIDPANMEVHVDPEEYGEHYIPLQTIFPVDKWPNLKHFGLLGFFVKHDDLISLLGTLPSSLQSVELSFLKFYGSPPFKYQHLLRAMRDELSWRKRDVSARPIVLVGTNLHTPVSGRAIWLQEEIYEFLYHGGDDPFSRDNYFPDQGKGTVKDEFDTTFERPHVSSKTYMELGYYEETQYSIS